MIDKSFITTSRLLWDCEFHYKLLSSIIKISDSKVSALLSSIILRECTVFVQEMSKYIPSMEEIILTDTSKVFSDSYRLIRDKIHYFSSQPFCYSTEEAIAKSVARRMQLYYLTRPIDDMSVFRYDLSYVKVDDVIYSSSMDIHMLIDGTPIEKNGKILPDVLRQYCKDLASLISSVRQGFVGTNLDEMIHLDDFCLSSERTNVELFDGKLDVAVRKSGFSEYLTILSLRFLSDLGSLIYMIKKLFTDDWINSHYLYFLARLIAIRFDEISDAVYRIDKDFPNDEAIDFINLLKANDIYPFPEDLRLVAKRLRNSIHYNSSSEIWSLNFNKSFYWHENFLKQARTKSSSFTNWPDDYLILKDQMLTHLELLHNLLSSIFDYKLKFQL